MFTKKFNRRVYAAVIGLGSAAVLGVSFALLVMWPSTREAGYTPSQPIAFNHELHAGEMQIDCRYCHSEAEKGPHATVPPLSTCMNCHTEVQPRDEHGELGEALTTLLEHWETKTEVAWNKVNDVADFVYFDHSRHLAAEVKCQTCHGPVEKMEHLRREEGLKMSWCLDCHKQEPKEGSVALALGRKTQAPINCTTCHR